MKSKPASSIIRWSILSFVMSGVFLSTMDSGMLNVALPSIMRSFNMSLEDTELVVTVYLLTITATLVFWGKLSDRFGRGAIYITGLAIFAAGALACYLASTFQFLLCSRFIQALGAAMMMSSGPAIIKESFPATHLGRSLGLVGIATACGLLAGPFVSGQILLLYSWKETFLVSSSVSSLVFVIGFFLMRNQLPSKEQTIVEQFDLKGGLCWVGIAILGILLLNRIGRTWSSSTIIIAALLLLLIIAFIRLEKKSQNPIVPMRLFLKKYYWIAISCATISFAVLFSVLVLIPFYLEYVLAVSTAKVGVVMMAVPATLMVLSPSSGYLYDKIGAKLLTSTGLFVTFFALCGLATLSHTSSLQEVALVLGVLGAGQSIFLSPNSASVLSRVEDQYLGVTSGILATARNFGMVVGATFAASLFSFLYKFYNDGATLSSYSAVNESTFMSALQVAFITIAIIALTGAVLSAFRD